MDDYKLLEGEDWSFTAEDIFEAAEYLKTHPEALAELQEIDEGFPMKEVDHGSEDK